MGIWAAGFLACWFPPHLKKLGYSASVEYNALDVNQLKISPLSQADDLTGNSAHLLFTGTRQAINTGFGTAQGQSMGPSWLFVYKYR